MTCTVNHLLIELGVSRRKKGREIMDKLELPEGMWICRLCEAWNNDIRNYCYKCSASRAIPTREERRT